jgi:hypothetical protein
MTIACTVPDSVYHLCVMDIHTCPLDIFRLVYRHVCPPALLSSVLPTRNSPAIQLNIMTNAELCNVTKFIIVSINRHFTESFYVWSTIFYIPAYNHSLVMANTHKAKRTLHAITLFQVLCNKYLTQPAWSPITTPNFKTLSEPLNSSMLYCGTVLRTHDSNLLGCYADVTG